jgi:hypothetical protein
MTALARSLIDRAYPIRREEIGQYVEGEPDVEVTDGIPFPARLQIEVATEGDEPLARRAVSATLTCAPEADLHGADAVEVESEAYGTATWEIDGAPLSLLRGREVVGWRVRLTTVGD